MEERFPTNPLEAAPAPEQVPAAVEASQPLATVTPEQGLPVAATEAAAVPLPEAPVPQGEVRSAAPPSLRPAADRPEAALDHVLEHAHDDTTDAALERLRASLP